LANFSGATFEKSADFSGVRFGADASFAGAAFGIEVELAFGLQDTFVMDDQAGRVWSPTASGSQLWASIGYSLITAAASYVR
jgi:hypothetical protein